MKRRSWGGNVLLGLAIGLQGSAAAAQDVVFEPVGEIPGPADLVRVQGDYAYVSAHKTFTIYDLGNPSEPERKGSYEFAEEIWNFRLDQDRAYVGANFFGLGILDISDPATPKLAGSHKTLGQAKVGAAFGSKIVIIDHMEGVVVIDASKEAEPLSLGSFFVDGYARDVLTSGTMAYAVDSPSGLYIFDLSRSGPLEPLSVLHAPGTPNSIEISAPGQGPARLCGPGGGNLQIYDVSNPAEPARASTFVTPGRAHRVAIDGDLVYVADGAAGVHVVDITNPAAPSLVATYPSARPARDVSVAGSYVFLVVGDSERQGNDRDIVILRRVE